MYRYRFIFLLIVSVNFLSCSHQEQLSEESQTETDGLIKVTPEQMEKIGLELGTLQKKRISNGISVNGYLDTPPQYKASVSSVISGQITTIRYLPGDHVNKGQEIIRIESPEFVDLQKNYLEIKSELKYLEDEYERQKKLSENNINARKIFLQAERDFQSKLAQMAALENKLRILKADPAELTWKNISPILRIYSPIKGYISRIYVQTSEYIHSEDEILRIVNPEHLHAELNVYEKDILKVRKGQDVEIRVSQFPDSIYYGEIFLVGKELDPKTRSVNIHVHVPKDKNWVAGMYVEGMILTRNHETFVVPASALIREETGTYIYLVDKEEQNNIYLKRIMVTTGAEYEDVVEVQLPDEVSPETRIATDGVYYLSTSG